MRLFAHLLATTAALISAPALAQDFIIDDALKEDRALVRELQGQLNDLGFNAGATDGAFGGKTQSALTAFADRFPLDGVLGLTPQVAARVASVHTGRFGNPFELATLVKPTGWTLSREAGQTDVREDNAACGACNVTPWILAVGDLSGDGRDEVVLAGHLNDANFNVIDVPSVINIFELDEKSNLIPFSGWAPGETAPARVHEREALIEDFNGDGIGDLFIAATGYDARPFPGEQNVLLLSSPEGHRDVSMDNLPSQNDMSHGADAGDIDGDGDIDILVMTNEGSEKILPYVLRNDGTGSFTKEPFSVILDPAYIDFNNRGRAHRAEYSTIRLMDADGDGLLDLFLLARGESPREASRFSGTTGSLLFYNQGDGTFSGENMAELPTDRWGYGTFTNDADMLDIDGDGDRDLILTQSTRAPNNGTWYNQYLQVLMNEDGDWVDRTDTVLWPQGYPNAEDWNFAIGTSLADVDGDGDTDLVTRSLDPIWKDSPLEGVVMVGLNTGEGRFEPAALDWLTGRLDYTDRSMIAGDLDGNGKGDIVAFGLNGQYGNGPDQTWGTKLRVHLRR